MSKNNLNNKFGKCCNCPALSTGKQLFTNFESFLNKSSNSLYLFSKFHLIFEKLL